MKWLKKVAATPLTNIAKVIDSLEQSANDRLNAPSIRAVRAAVEGSAQTLFPIGSIYMSVNEVNPSTIFGGTWQQIKDRFILASGDTYANGATGGSATNTLTAAQLPSHSHSYTAPSSVGGHALTVNEMPSHGHSVTGSTSQVVTDVPTVQLNSPEGTAGSYINYVDEITPTKTQVSVSGTAGNTGGGAEHSHALNTSSGTTGATGSGAAINNMPPYLAVNVWVRTA